MPLGIDKVGDVNFNIANLVTEKLGKINKDYTLLNPPIGKGSFFPIFFDMLKKLNRRLRRGAQGHSQKDRTHARSENHQQVVHIKGRTGEIDQ